MKKSAYNPHEYLKFTRTISKVVTFFYYASILLMILLVIAAAATLILPKSLFSVEHFSKGYFTFQLNGPIGIQYDSNSIPKGTSFRSIFTAIIGASFIMTLVYFNILKHTRCILAETLNKNPFSAKNARHLTLIASTFLGASFAFPVFTSLVSERIIEALALSNHRLNYAPDTNLLLASLFIFLLSGIFRYGTFLQKEYDETI